MYKFPAVPRLAVRPLILRFADFLGCDRAGPAWRCWLLVVLYVLIVSGMVDRIAYILSYNPADHVWSDTKRHWEHGVSILRDDPFIMGEAIMFQLYIAVLGKITVNIPILIAFYTIVLSLLTPWIWYRFFRELQPSKLMAVAGWAGIALLPSWHSIYGYFMQETLMLPLLGAALYYTWRCRRKQTVASFVLMILFWALAGLTRGICIPMAAVATIWLWSALALAAFLRMLASFFGLSRSSLLVLMPRQHCLPLRCEGRIFLECLSFLRLALAMKPRFDLCCASPCRKRGSTRLLLCQRF